MSVAQTQFFERTVSPSRRAPLGRVAYLVSRFPKLTETFVLYEVLAVERQGVPVELYSLQRERTSVMHPEAKAMLERVHFGQLFSPAIARAHCHFLRRRPAAYFGALWTLIRANWGSRRYLAAAILFFPKIVYFAWNMRQQGITHIHAHFASHPAAAALVIGRLTGIPYSFTAHGSDLHRDQHMLREKVAEAEFIVAISRYNQQLIVQHCGAATQGKVQVIHCGVDTDLFRPFQKAVKTAGERDQLQILCVGTLHEVKGQQVLIAACRKLADRGIGFRCHFAGDGPDRAKLQQQVRRARLTQHVVFHGQKTREEIVALIGHADVVAAPSIPTRDGRREGIPVALMEAMASGAAVVASRLSGIPELVEDGVSGLLVAPGDADALADAIERLASDDELRRQLHRAARNRILRQFDLRTNAETLASRFATAEASNRLGNRHGEGRQSWH